MRLAELGATTALTLAAGWLSWRNTRQPRNVRSFVGEAIWPTMGLVSGPFLRRAFDTRGAHYAAGLNVATSEAAERGRIRGWQAILKDAWRFQEKAEQLAERARPADDYQRAFLDRARAKLATSRELLVMLGNPP